MTLMTLKDVEHEAYLEREKIAFAEEKEADARRKNYHACNDTHWLATTAHLAVSVECAKCGIYLTIAGQVANTLLVNTEHTCRSPKPLSDFEARVAGEEQFCRRDQSEAVKNSLARSLLDSAVASERVEEYNAPIQALTATALRIKYENVKAELVKALGDTGGMVSDGHPTEPADKIPSPWVLGLEGPSPDHFSESDRLACPLL